MHPWRDDSSLVSELKRLDPACVDVTIDELSGRDASWSPPDLISLATVVGAAAAAARGAATAAESARGRLELSALKKHIDGAATTAAEALLDAAAISIRVSAGEGERDASPGAEVGQRLGQSNGVDVYSGVFDYVDGTALAAAGLPGALSLGGLGRDLRSVPDLQAFAVLVPTAVAHEIDVMARVEDVVDDTVRRIARHAARDERELVVATHSVSSTRSPHMAVVRRLRAKGVHVLVPDPVTIEPPYLLSLAGLAAPRIDSMIGAIGLSELAFAALLLDLVRPGYAFVFRLAGVDALRASEGVRLDSMFDLTPTERESYARTGWNVARPYRTTDIVPEGHAVAAALFAVTANDMLDLAPPVLVGGLVTTSGLALTPGGGVLRMRLANSNARAIGRSAADA